MYRASPIYTFFFFLNLQLHRIALALTRAIKPLVETNCVRFTLTGSLSAAGAVFRLADIKRRAIK